MTPILRSLLVLGALAALSSPSWATSVLPRTVVDLIELSELILVGEVESVTDGFTEAGVPYTEIRLRVSEAIRGEVGSTYTFRQFGLAEPRPAPNGMTYLATTPDGWPRFQAGESVVLFLYKAARITGFRTTVGLFQGKFVRERDGLVNGSRNLGLFRSVRVDRGLLSDRETRMLDVREGPVETEAFLGLVRKAVRDRWVETERIRQVPR